jgi:transcriptional regulator with XRE-family HTH domain
VIKAIGKRIRDIRNSKGIEAKLMASKLKMNESGYSKIERGETNIPTSRLLQIAEILKVNAGEFFYEGSVISFGDTKSNYGFVTKEEFDSLERKILSMEKMLEKLVANTTPQKSQPKKSGSKKK